MDAICKTCVLQHMFREADDRAAYAQARAYLLRFGSQGVTEKVLEHYLEPPPLTDTTMAAVFRRLLLSLRNRSMMASAINDETVDLLGPVLYGFNPAEVTQHFTSWEKLLDTIEKELNREFRRAPGSLWPLFARGTLSGAQFLNQFPDEIATLSSLSMVCSTTPRAGHRCGSHERLPEC